MESAVPVWKPVRLLKKRQTFYMAPKRRNSLKSAWSPAPSLTLQLTMQDVMQADTDPEALGRKLAGTAANKRWLHHPKAETFLAERVALLQRVYKR